MSRKRRTGNGSSIYLGGPIATPTGVFIGRPGPTIFKASTKPQFSFGGANFILSPASTVTFTLGF